MTWLAGSMLLLGLALMAGFAWYERSHPTSHVLALIATLAALAALGRIAFAPIPNVKPTTDIVLIAGYVLGGAPGFAVGAVAALASNLFFGQGPWTPWQMGAWGLVGLGGAGLAALFGRQLGRSTLTAACFAAGLVYGAVMNFSLWVTYSGDHTVAKLGSYFATSLPWDLAHALGNAAFCLAFGPALVAALTRYRKRFEVVWKPAAAGLAALVVLAAPAAAGAAVPAQSVQYLRASQNADGGFGPEPGRTSTGLHTGWAALGLAAAGRNPADEGVLRYMGAHVRELNDLGELSRTILVLEASGRSARSFAGRDLVRELISRQKRGGAFAGRVNTTSFAILALRASGHSTKHRRVRNAARWVARQANEDGGFNFSRKGGASGVDDTGAAVQALVAAGRRGTPTVKRAAAFLASEQADSGGWPLVPGGPANAQSTAWAVQALIAARASGTRVRRGQSYLRSLTGADGAVRYSRTSRQTPVWVTAQAIVALAGKPFPLAEVPRRVTRSAAPVATATPTSTATPTPVATPVKRARPARTPVATPAPLAALPVAAVAEQARLLGAALALVL
jgi:energy-coupling factor transport system substrate-specific component